MIVVILILFRIYSSKIGKKMSRKYSKLHFRLGECIYFLKLHSHDLQKSLHIHHTLVAFTNSDVLAFTNPASGSENCCFSHNVKRLS